MVSRVLYLLALTAWIAALWLGLDYAGRPKAPLVAIPTASISWPDFFAANILPSLPVTDEFDPPLRPPDGQGAVITLPFQEVGHLGEDWTTAKGEAAMGEPVYSVADGWVSVAYDFENAWGKVVFICYRLPPPRYPPVVEVMYAMLQTMDVSSGQYVKRGQKIGTMGDGNGTYHDQGAHLHWEVRDWIGTGLGLAFSKKTDGLLAPSDFLAAHRGPRIGQPLQAKVLAPNERDGWGTDY